MVDLYSFVDDLDRLAVERYAMSEELLMEHAAIAMKDEIIKRFNQAKVLIVCGAGNNGADGLALARLLDIYGYDVEILLVNEVRSNLATIQLQRVKKLGIKIVDKIDEYDLIVDAIFGSGLNRTLDDKVCNLIDKINQKKAYKIACDVPSGINKNGDFTVAFKADLTITMGAKKVALYNDKIKDFVGEIVVANLGINSKKYKKDSEIKLLEKIDLKLPNRVYKDSHKGSYGHLAVFVGEKSGAGIIAAMSALRFGSGLVTAISKEKLQNLPFEIMQSNTIPNNINAVAIGMGIGDSFADQEILDLIKDRLVIIDADLLRKNIIIDILDSQKDIIITPHPKEFVDLMRICGFKDIGVDELQKDRLSILKSFSERYKNCVVLLKGANVIIAKNGKLFVNSFGSNVLAKGGSGDVLSGMIGALLAQGYPPLEATINASLAHALASNNFAKNSYAMTPIDLIELIATLEV